MASLQVFDRPLCCSSGVCGPEVDPALAAFAADLAWLQRSGVQVERVNPAQQPALFAASPIVIQELQAHGNGCLPVVVVDGAVVSRGVYPDRRQLTAWTGIAVTGNPVTGNPVTAPLPILMAGCCGPGERSDGGAGCCE
jgi:hypothetical protein